MSLALPEEVWANIFSHMDIEDILFNVRRVCHLWHETAGRPEVWKRQVVSDCVEGRRSARIVSLALKVAPCIGMLQVLHWCAIPDLDLTSIDCGVLNLHLALHNGHEYQKEVMCNLKKKHLLKEIRLDINCTEREFQWFFESALSLNLLSLTLDSSLGQSSDGFVDAILQNIATTQQPQLKVLHYEGGLSDGVMEVVLRARGRSLTSVSIVDTKDVGLEYPTLNLIPRTCPNLYELAIPPTLHLEELLKCRNLKRLTLFNIFLPNDPQYHEWKETLLRFCRSAWWLVHLRLRACTNDPRSFEIILDVVRAFSTSGESKLEILSLDEQLEEHHHTRLREALQTLPKQPQLTFEDWMGGAYLLPPLVH